MQSSNLAQSPNSTTKWDVLSVAEGRAITDPNSILKTVSLLRDESVVKALQLDDVQKTEIVKLLDETRGQPGIVFFPKVTIINGVKDRELIPKEEIELMSAVIQRQREQVIREILDPMQCDRLAQIAYNIEVHRAGLASAILDGFLGESAGVEQAERTALAATFELLQSEYANAKSAIMESSENEILAFLTESQRKSIRQVIGKALVLKETHLEKLVRIRNLRVSDLPDPESVVDSCRLLDNRSILEELDLSQIKTASVLKIRKSKYKNESEKSLIEDKIRNLLAPDRVARLRQIAYQLEVAKLGFGATIAKGFLGKAINIEDSQRESILAKLPEIELRNRDSLRQLEILAKNKMMSLLSENKRRTIVNLLGDAFEVVN